MSEQDIQLQIAKEEKIVASDLTKEAESKWFF